MLARLQLFSPRRDYSQTFLLSELSGVSVHTWSSNCAACPPQRPRGSPWRRLWRRGTVSVTDVLLLFLRLLAPSRLSETPNFHRFSSTLKPGVPPPLPPKPRLNSSSEELGLNDERSLTVRRFPSSENGPNQAVRRQSTPEHGNKGEHQPPDFLSVSVSSPGLLSHASDPGELAGSSFTPPPHTQTFT